MIIVKARLSLISTEEGGRKGPIYSGYRPEHVFDYSEGSYVGDIQLGEHESMNSGDVQDVIIRFISPKTIKYLTAGRKWDICEGGRLIARAEVIELINS